MWEQQYHRNNNVIRQFLHFKVSKKQLRSTAAYFTCQKRLLNEEVLNQNCQVATTNARDYYKES